MQCLDECRCEELWNCVAVAANGRWRRRDGDPALEIAYLRLLRVVFGSSRPTTALSTSISIHLLSTASERDQSQLRAHAHHSDDDELHHTPPVTVPTLIPPLDTRAPGPIPSLPILHRRAGSNRGLRTRDSSIRSAELITSAAARDAAGTRRILSFMQSGAQVSCAGEDEECASQNPLLPKQQKHPRAHSFSSTTAAAAAPPPLRRAGSISSIPGTVLAW